VCRGEQPVLTQHPADDLQQHLRAGGGQEGGSRFIEGPETGQARMQDRPGAS
jgi:hypothetical protein